jgi:hypothetical protein
VAISRFESPRATSSSEFVELVLIGELGDRLLGQAVDHPAGDRRREQRVSAAIVCTAAISSSGRFRFSKKPKAPARSAPKT